MDLSLDDIITQTKGNRRSGPGGRGRGRGRGAVSSGRGAFRTGTRTFAGGRGAAGLPTRNLNFRRNGNSDGVWAHDKFMDMGGGAAFTRARAASLGGGSRGGAKLVIGNLHFAVSEADLKELFSEFGPILDATINYDMSGRSLGKADLTFQRRSSAQAAIAKYSGVPLDGRPMDIQWATPTGLSAPPPPRILARVAGGRVRGTGRGGVNKPVTRGRGRGGRTQVKPPTAEELDAELDAYVRQSVK